ncbi:phosphoenolpyruvate carboxylase [Sorangium cellulosum]|uniref:phosphoenolpyruvate carboxylase n=1 Tax=Sorangium cellulosum TaxID=56 RepID=UPI003D9A5124
MPPRRREVDRPLRKEVRLLGRLLGEVLIEQEGEELFAIEERIRTLAIRRRRGPSDGRAHAAAELTKLLASLPHDRIEPVIRAFTVYFRLVNLAEQHHRIRRARAYLTDPGARPQRGSLEAAMRTLKDAGVPAERVRAALRSLDVTLTLTAHPTEAARRTVLEKLYRIAKNLEERDRCHLTPEESARKLAEIREEITALWQTDEVRRDRPTVGDEVKNVAWYIEEILWDLLPELPAAIGRAFEAAYGEPLDAEFVPLRIHSWVGADMDGNPLVVPAVLEDALFAYRIRGLRRLIRAARELGGALSQSLRHVTPPPWLLASIEEDAAAMPEVAAHFGPRTEGEPWRRKLRFIEARLTATLEHAEHGRAEARARYGQGPAREGRAFVRPEEPTHAVPYREPAELERDLALVADSLRAAGCARSGERRARALLSQVRALGFALAELEMRAPAEDARAAAAEVAAGRVEPAQMGPEARRVFEALQRIAAAQRDSGESACRTLVLSMTQSENDILAALECARAAGLWDEARSCARIDVVPLFESLGALNDSARILRALLAHPQYRPHVLARGVQEVMIGYSDSGKEVGLLAASAALRRVQETLPKIAAEAELPLRVFHGRGESVARGGGPAHQALLALPAGSVGGRYKATEQGEALDHKYARPELAMRTLELMLSGVVLHTLGAQPRPPAASELRFAAAFDELAETGRRVYRELVWEEPRFVEFFTAVTPIDEIARLPLGSRPSKRRAGGLESLRAIPWVFAWTQNRAILPGWYGVGSGLEAMGQRPEGAELLKEMMASWPFFRAVIDNVEMVLAKADMTIFADYAELAPAAARKAVAPRIIAEYRRTRSWLKRLTGNRRLLEGNPTLQRSISLRNPYVDPLSFLQVELLRASRGGDSGCDRSLLLTLNGIAAGMRNTG